MDELIKEIIDTISGVTWSPGTYPRSLAGIKETPAGAWKVSENASGSTSTRSAQFAETTVSITVWAGTAEARSAARDAVSAAFGAVGFGERPNGMTEMLLPDKTTAYVLAMTFRAWIDTSTYWVYKNRME